MGRRQTIDRGALLDAAEAIVLREGAASLTIDAVAKEAGVSKGGVLYAYATKDALIDAIMGRVMVSYEQAAAEYLAQNSGQPHAAVFAHIEANRQDTALDQARAVALMATFLRAPEFYANTLTFYQGLFANADTNSEAGRRIRLALLATEGAFVVRGFGLYPFSDADWQAIHDDIIAILMPA